MGKEQQEKQTASKTRTSQGIGTILKEYGKLCNGSSKQGVAHMVAPEQGTHEVEDECRQRDVRTNEQLSVD